jgi:hypothetical protein
MTGLNYLCVKPAARPCIIIRFLMQGLGGGCRFWSPLREGAGRQAANRRRQTFARTPSTQEARRCDQEEESSVLEFADGIGLFSAWHYPTLLNLLATSATEQQAVGETRVYRPVYMQKPVVLVMQVQSEQDWAELGEGGNARGEHCEWRFNAQPFTLEDSGFATRFEAWAIKPSTPPPPLSTNSPWAWSGRVVLHAACGQSETEEDSRGCLPRTSVTH